MAASLKRSLSFSMSHFRLSDSGSLKSYQTIRVGACVIASVKSPLDLKDYIANQASEHSLIQLSHRELNKCDV